MVKLVAQGRPLLVIKPELREEACLGTADAMSWRQQVVPHFAARAEVDLVRLDTASTLLKWQVATTGVPLSEISPGEFAKFQARAASEYIDFAPAFAYHGEIFRRRLVEQGKGAPPDPSNPHVPEE